MIKFPFTLGFSVLLISQLALGFKCKYFDSEDPSYPGYSCMVDTTSIGHLASKNNNDIKNIFHDGRSSKQTFEPFNLQFCSLMHNLQTVYFIKSAIITLNDTVLHKCYKLLTIDFSDNEIAEIPKEFFSRNQKLTKLSMRNNKLTYMDDDVFASQGSLKELRLSGNQLTILSQTVFSRLTSLEVLQLSENKIQILDSNLFKNLGNLKELLLQFNHILELPENIFDSLTKLEELNLFHNNLLDLLPNLFHNLQSLKILNLGANRISDLPPNIFYKLKSLKTLRIDQNKITDIHSDSFGIHPVLAKIYLSSNKINSIDEVLIRSVKFEELDLFNNICCSEKLKTKTQKLEVIHERLRQCFENYVRRENLAYQFSSKSVIQDQQPNVLNPQCGNRKIGQPNVVHGVQIARGQYPWTAALVKNNGEFFCGGTLISNKKVLTAAHCIEGKFRSHLHRPKDFVIYLGVFNLSSTTETYRVVAAVKNITTHNDWNPNIQSFDADIAILDMEKEVAFNEFIQPICLIKPREGSSSISVGVVIGFGASEHREVESIARFVEIPIHSYQKCTESSDHQSLVSHRTFCGGYANGTGVCTGDSGSALIVYHSGAFYLRGIVSASLYGPLHGCNVHSYSVFTDAVAFYNWIITGHDY